MIISQDIKNLVSGVSQQAPILRLPEQLEEQLNGWSTESSGLTKRPPTVFVKSLLPALENEEAPLLHFVDRDKNLKYFIYFHKNLMYVIDTKGNKYNVLYKADPAYISTNKPQETLRVVTIADHTFIVNKTVQTIMSNKRSPNVWATQGALVNVKQGQYGRTYTVNVNGEQVASWETPDGSDQSHTKMIATTYIVDQLTEQIKGKGYTVDKGSSWFRIRGAKTISTSDGFNNQAMLGFTTSAQKFSSLPVSAPDGYTLKITGDPDGDGSGSYYVEYDSKDNVWKECVRPDIAINIEPASMPHELVRQANNTFVFQQVEWADRAIGDEDSNPLPSFIGSPINDISFHRNRLVLLSGENVICSESAEYFNFWMTTASDVTDTDPIDVSTTTDRVNILNYAVPYSGELYCFSDKSQFVLRSDDVLSPKNTALVEITEFNSNPDCRPVRAGRNLYFPADRSEFTTIKEFYSVQQVSDEKNAQDITSHVPDYIPNGVYQIASNTNENILCFLTKGDKTALYVYKYLFMNEQRVQSSWSKWELGERIFGAFFVGSSLYLLINRGGRHCMEKMNFTSYSTDDIPNKEPYRVYLDCKKVSTTAKYDVNTKTTSIDILREYTADIAKGFTTIGIVTNDGKYHIENVRNGKVTLLGNYQGKNIVLGIPYKFHVRLSPIYVHAEAQNGSKTVLTGRLQLRYVRLNYANTGGFRAIVRYAGGKQSEYVMTGKNVGLKNAELGRVPNETGIFKIPIQTLNTNATIDIDSDIPLPISLIGFLWEGNFVQRSKGA